MLNILPISNSGTPNNYLNMMAISCQDFSGISGFQKLPGKGANGPRDKFDEHVSRILRVEKHGLFEGASCMRFPRHAAQALLP